MNSIARYPEDASYSDIANTLHNIKISPFYNNKLDPVYKNLLIINFMGKNSISVDVLYGPFDHKLYCDN